MAVINDAPSSAPQGIHIVAKPAGPSCNLNCAYCFYLEKQALYGNSRNYRMPDQVLATYIKSYIECQPTPAVEFVWQGGEPTLAGLDFYRRVIELQRPYLSIKTISNVLQTNGTLLDDSWCQFLQQHNFMVGISLDGPEEVHDRYRHGHNGKGTFKRALQGLKLLQKHGVDYNVMASVARETARKPLDVYKFFKEEGVEFIQFAPIVERLPNNSDQLIGLQLAAPLAKNDGLHHVKITPWTVLPEEYGDFLIAIYEEWVRNDVGTTFVMNFEWALNAWIGNPSPVCIHSKQCGRSLVIEHNGDLFSCDHYVYPQYTLGNILHNSLSDMISKAEQTELGSSKETGLSDSCLECEVLAACQGGCPKHRFTRQYSHGSGQNYLCPAYQKFFGHIRKYLHAMTTLLENGYPASGVMEAIKGPLFLQPQDTEHII